jgi:hypothetical protein
MTGSGSGSSSGIGIAGTAVGLCARFFGTGAISSNDAGESLFFLTLGGIAIKNQVICISIMYLVHVTF